MRIAAILSEIVIKMSEIQKDALKITGRVKLKGKKSSAKTKSGIIGPRLHLNSVFQLVLTVNPLLFAISK